MSIGGITRDGVVWAFDNPGVARDLAIRISDQKEVPLNPGERFVVDFAFDTFLVKKEGKDFRALADVAWTCSADSSFEKPKISRPAFNLGIGGDFGVFQSAYQAHLRLYKNNDGYKFVK